MPTIVACMGAGCVGHTLPDAGPRSSSSRKHCQLWSKAIMMPWCSFCYACMCPSTSGSQVSRSCSHKVMADGRKSNNRISRGCLEMVNVNYMQCRMRWQLQACPAAFKIMHQARQVMWAARQYCVSSTTQPSKLTETMAMRGAGSHGSRQ